jgi:transcriptional regulator with XRE-family HTH domain
MDGRKPNGNGSMAGYFGRTLRKARLAKGWSLDELGRRSGVHPAHLSKVETGNRAPTESVARAVDSAFGGSAFWELYREVSTWAPPGFRDWSEHEDKTATIREWAGNGNVPGLLQTEDYARTLLTVHPGVSGDVIATRLKSRMERQRRVFGREVRAWFIVDHAALYRLVGSPEIMAGQMDRLADVASRPVVTLQILPSVAHPAVQGGFLLADDAVYAETVTSGYVHTEAEKLSSLDTLFDTLRAECYRASESLMIVKKAGETWNGASRATAAATEATA